jgi:superfamily II DNA or RNA helicase
LQAIARLAGDMPFGIPTDVHFGTPSPSGGVLRARAIGDPRAVLGWTDRHTATAGWPSPNHDDAAGPVRFQVDRKSQAALTPFEYRLIARETAFRILPESANDSIQSIYHALASDATRNDQILNDVIAAIHEGRSPILLTERKDHLEFFARYLSRMVKHILVLQGRMSAKERRNALDRLALIPVAEERLILATGRYIGEGFDDARLDTLFLALPISWKGTLVQYSGRLHRHHAGTREVRIYDYVDGGVPVLLRMFEKRLRTYRAIGYARGEAPLGFAEPSRELTVEYDDEALRHFAQVE